jgi:hypothetical protein
VGYKCDLEVTMATHATRRKAREEEHPREVLAPRTHLGRHLWKIRRRIVVSGARLLSWDEIDREVAERRGER